LGAFVDNINREFRFIGTSASGCGTATVGLSLAAARGLGARAGNFFGKWYFLPDFLAHSLELANSAASDFWDLAGSGHGVHDDSGLLDLLIDHDGPGECLFDGAHLDLLLELLVFNLSYNGLELRLLFICVLVLDGEWLLFNFRLLRTTAVCLSLAAAARVGVREHLFEMGQLLRGIFHYLPLAPRVEEVPGEEPGELIALFGGADKVGSIDNVDSIGLASTTGTLLFNSTGKSTWFRDGNLFLRLGNHLNNALLEGNRSAERGPSTFAASVDRSDLAHDIITSA
jgi:hypothetical protein